MRRLTALIALAAFTGIATACGVTSPEEGLEDARALWARNGPASYAMTVHRSCECTPEMSGPVRVTVRDGVVETRTYVPSGAAVGPQYADVFPRVEGMFDLVDAAVRAGTPDVELRHHRILGYPVRMQLGDPAIDAPVYLVSEFEPL